MLNLFNNRINIVRNFRNKNNIRTACYATVECNPTCVTSHYFQSHNAMVRFRSSMQSVYSFRSTSYRSIKTKGTLRTRQVVVDSLGYTNNFDTTLTRKFSTDVQASVTANNNQSFDIMLLKIFDYLVSHIIINKLAIFFNGKFKRVIAVGSS